MAAEPDLLIACDDTDAHELEAAGHRYLGTVQIGSGQDVRPTRLYRRNGAAVREYSFDDASIGQARPSNTSLETRELRRPPRLSDREWYAYAAETCKLLNGLIGVVA